MMPNPPLSFLLNHFDARDLLDALAALLAGQGCYSLDAQQRVLFWDPAVAEMTGLSPEAVLARPCPEALLPDAPDTDGLVRLTDSTGETQTLKKSVQKIYTDDGIYLGAVGMLNPCVQTSPKDIRSLKKSAKQNFYGIISRSPAMQAVFQTIENAAETTATVLVRGESGAGKELVARAIHQLSARRQAPFLAINCAALSSSLLESELFGHVRGAFSGAIKDHHGLFQRAHGGTLFLDEVAEMPLDLQAKLLRVVQERNYIPVGGDRTVSVDVRLVAATHRSLREQVKKGEFREDLMYRLRVVPIFIPPLRERREDISLLLWHFIGVHNQENLRKIDKIEPMAMKILLDYPWPGNVRELHNVIEYAFAVGRGNTLRLHELPPEFHEPPEPSNSPPAPILPASDEAARIQAALQQSQGGIDQAAKLLGMSRATFWRKRKRYGL